MLPDWLIIDLSWLLPMTYHSQVEQLIRSGGPGYHPFTGENRPFEARLWVYTTNFTKVVDTSANFSTPEGTDYRETDDDWWTFDYSHSNRPEINLG